MNNVSILITDGMAKEGVDYILSHQGFKVDLRKSTSKEELAEIIGNYDCIIIRSATTLTAELLQLAKNMKLIVRAGAGVDNIDVKKATELKIPVMNTASANSQAAAEQTIALMFSMVRQTPQAAASLAAGRWDRDSFKGFEITGKTLGVIGLGNIGRIVAEKALGLGMNVIGFDPMIKESSLQKSVNFKMATHADEVITNCNILTVHVPKTKETTNFINAEKISKMKPKSFIINCSRGGIVDELAVIRAIDEQKLSGAAFDVFEKEPPVFPNPLFTHPKIVCAPHLGASTFEAQERVAATAASQLIAYFSKGEKTGIIN